MTRTSYVMAAVLLLGSVVTARADRWGSPTQTEFFSANRKHMLKIDIHPDWPDKPGHCRATLFRLDGEKRTELWSRYLINNYAPYRVFVTDSGEYVVTMDEWASIGELPIVIYGRKGALVKVHSTDSLGLRGDILQIRQTVSSYWWDENSISFFGPSEESFIIRLHWGKLVFLDLRDGDLMDAVWYETTKGWYMPEDKWRKLHQYATEQVKASALKCLSSESAGERETGAMICGQEKFEEAKPRLRELLKDRESYSTNFPTEWTRCYYVRKAAKQALEAMGEKVEGVVTEEPEKRNE